MVAGTSAGLPGSFWYLLAGAFVNRLGYMVEPSALYLAGPRDLEPSIVGLVLAAFGVGAFASQPIGGYLADRFGRRAFGRRHDRLGGEFHAARLCA